MHEALGMNRCQACGNFASDLAKLIGSVAALRFATPNMRVERLTGDVFHHQDRAPRARRQVMDSAHVRVTHRAGE